MLQLLAASDQSSHISRFAPHERIKVTVGTPEPQAQGERLRAALYLPPRYTSSVKYDSERHFIDDVHLPLGLAVTSCSQTVTCIPNCTWRNYRSQLTLEPRPRALHFRSTTIIFPKRARNTFRTTLHCSLGRPSRRFTSSVQLQLLLGPAAL